jgi:hypothetical protein
MCSIQRSWRARNHDALAELRPETGAMERRRTALTAEIRKLLRKRLPDWRLVQRQTPVARQMVSQLLDSRIVCTPHKAVRVYEFAGRVKFDQLLEGTLFTQGVYRYGDITPRVTSFRQ